MSCDSWWQKLWSMLFNLLVRSGRRELEALNAARFQNLEKQKLLYVRLRGLRSKHFHEEFEGASKLSSGEFVVMSVDLPKELEVLDAERVGIEERMERIRKRLDRFYVSI